ncbi:Uncharacterised protein [Sphingobacterium spiritivorum]|uniref:Uncharacterized protein n=1 Tax=Sphingobacterium spiritivorum TaxID=258 RepID=A0A380CQD0_SPHSI|nr:hypothetical protein [Sphingobacterium spiritivorum]SUJ26532.1 Uncharacterised protein [Sphingobacterium spiritivorum]
MRPIESIQKITLKEIAQTPFAYALYVITLVLVSVLVTQRYDAKAAAAICQDEKEELQDQIKAERREKDEVFKAYLVQRGVVEQIQKTVDSTAIIQYKHKRK